MKTQVRQGEVLLIPIQQLPSGLKRKDNILAYGEVTGHNHSFATTEPVSVFIDSKNVQYVDASAMVTLVHQEHAPVEVPRGLYEVRIQRNLDLQGIIRAVRD